MKYKIGDKVIFNGTDFVCTVINLPGAYSQYQTYYKLKLPDDMGYGLYPEEHFRKLTKLELALL